MNIKGLSKAAVLAVLYNNAKVQGMGVFQARDGDMTTEEAQKLLDDSKNKYFDYVYGRVVKISLKEDEVSTWGYNRDNGEDAAEKAVSSIR